MKMNDRIKKVRTDAGISQRNFGKTIGISGPSIARLETGENNPSEQTIRLISSAFKVNYQWLKDGLGPMYLPPDTDDELVDEVMAGENEFAKGVFRSFAKLGDEEWLLLRKIVDMISANKLNEVDADKSGE
jgi:transcriptional regulator with XRE-family HTH domain